MKKLILMMCTVVVMSLTACSDTAKETDRDSDVTALNKEISSTGTPTVLDFSAEWCGWCHKLEPILEEVEEKYDGKVEFETIDVDEQPKIAEQYNITGMPTLVFLDANGNEVDRIEGYTDAATIEKSVNKILK